jgi:hypothetical protein
VRGGDGHHHPIAISSWRGGLLSATVSATRASPMSRRRHLEEDDTERPDVAMAVNVGESARDGLEPSAR